MMKKIVILLIVLLMAMPAWADDGAMLRRNVSKTPDLETGHAYITMLEFYVTAQASDGTLLDKINYLDAEGNPAFTEDRAMAKPLISAYIDGYAEEVEGSAFRTGEHR